MADEPQSPVSKKMKLDCPDEATATVTETPSIDASVAELRGISTCDDCIAVLLQLDQEQATALKEIVQPEEQSEPTYTKPICPICLGTFTHGNTPLIEALADKVKEVASGITTCQIHLSLPKHITARQIIISRWVRSKSACLVPPTPEDFDYLTRVRDYLSQRICQLLGVTLDTKSEVSISIILTCPQLGRQFEFPHKSPSMQKNPQAKRMFKMGPFNSWSIPNIQYLFTEIAPEDLQAQKCWPPNSPQTGVKVEQVKVKSPSVFIAGRYNKYARGITNTPLHIKGKSFITSVSEQVAPAFEKAFEATDHKFCSSGREDVDVRMLGSGRPFYIEILNPKVTSLSADTIQNIQDEVNQYPHVQFHHLQIIDKSELYRIKEGEEQKSKTYCALVWVKDLPNIDLAEKLKPYEAGRAHLTRSKRVLSLKAEIIDTHFIQLTLATVAGTYIKEFVHGDCARTTPSLATILGCTTDILLLDVLTVDLEWPPSHH
ncbi:hypothetical protein BJ085DRAFT_40344 [Dimargaris cristalligena]|uniref:tRNA pseudouridine(55) synthase n=1 Tax=Dimargaris cristalligena TaxID=215637 RepID=A0A4P9ZVK5_9FUNG|nr:hypothetical protein BJ085DRAFT_40344 [Dimargaris cristalligena]|eukprot:RKP37613.1 hypothetical protein BJ085DRAFT_40344 [Dimargaris cristalligena]